MMRTKQAASILWLSIALGCAGGSSPEATSEPAAGALWSDSTDAEIMEHLYDAEMTQTATDALTTHFPDLSRERAYAIQRLRLADRESTSRRVGWKIGWSRLAGPEDELDPVAGHVMEDRVYLEDEPLSTRYFVNGSTGVEPEVVFFLSADLPGPVVSSEEVAAAVEEVGAAMEFVSGRLTEPHSREHAVADNVYGAGVVLGAERFSLEEVDFESELGQVEINGEILGEGPATDIMGENPFEALVWIANELPKYGMYLRAGDFVVTGTVCVPPPARAGDRARVIFTHLGTVSVDFVE